MGKVKWSFALILAFFLVGILSTAAFAKDPYGLKPVQVQGTTDLLVDFTSNSAVGDTDQTKYDLHVYDNSGNEITGSPFTALTVTAGKGSQTISGLIPGEVYKIQLTYTGNASVLSTSSGVVTISQNTALYNLKDNPGKVDKDGNGLKNSNLTGFNNIKKQRPNQKAHGFYQNNTNSCASCHQTHTASDGNLLFKDGVYSTCSACHDGTTGAYNSFTQTSGGGPNSIAGTFDVSTDNLHGSLHQADGSLQISAAPGGGKSTDSNVTSTSLYSSTWGSDFDCASCHAPHGGGSSAENNLNIDPLGWGTVSYASSAGVVVGTDSNGNSIISTKDNKYGKLFKDIPIYNSVPSSYDTPYILVKTIASGIPTDPSNVDKTSITYLYYRASVHNGDQIIQTYIWDGTNYVADYSLWLRDTGYKNAPFQNANTVLYDNTSHSMRKDITTTDMTVVWRDGFAFGPGVANVASADVSIGIDVETTENVQSLYNSKFTGTDSKDNQIAYIPDSGVEMTKFCAACHTDYMIDPATGKTGTLTAYHRHVESGVSGLTDQLTCVRCHFAHGTTSSIMKDSNDVLATTTDTLSGTNHSSALRRYVNMDSCYSSNCHNSSENLDPTSN